MATILPLAPSASLAPSGLLEPEGETIYTDAPTGVIGGTLVIGGGGIVKVGGTSVNQQPQRRQPRVYPQQAPPRLIHIEYRAGHDAPTGRISLSGTLSEQYKAIPQHDIRDVERLIRSLYPGGGSLATAATKPASTRELLEPFTGGSTDEQ